MTEGARTPLTAEIQRNIIARPIGGEAVLSVIGAGPGTRGPWSFVTGMSNPNIDMVGPPPQYLSVAAWAA